MYCPFSYHCLPSRCLKYMYRYTVLASVLKIEEVVNNSRERIIATQHCIVLETPRPIATSIRMSILQHQRVNNNK